MSENPPFSVARFYLFVDFPDFADWQMVWKNQMVQTDIRGTILIAAEGINGTIAGPRAALDEFFNVVRSDARFAALAPKFHTCTFMPFEKTKVRLKKEIVALKKPINVCDVGTYIKPEEWNDFIARDDVVVIDTRNDYEVAIGQFKGALNPHTTTFSQLPDYIAAYAPDWTDKKIAMYCTGGIRCEKSTAYLKTLGFQDVYHLQGGILAYLDALGKTIPAEASRWRGECFVFDDRIAV